MSDSRYRNYNIEIKIGLVSCDGAWYRKDRDGSYLAVAVMSYGFDCWTVTGGIFYEDKIYIVSVCESARIFICGAGVSGSGGCK